MHNSHLNTIIIIITLRHRIVGSEQKKNMNYRRLQKDLHCAISVEDTDEKKYFSLFYELK